MSVESGIASCRALLRDWRDHPAFAFPPPYTAFGEPLRQLATEPRALRLVEGVALRISRGDKPAAIKVWAVGFAARRGLLLPADFPA